MMVDGLQEFASDFSLLKLTELNTTNCTSFKDHVNVTLELDRYIGELV